MRVSTLHGLRQKYTKSRFDTSLGRVRIFTAAEAPSNYAGE